MIKSEHMKLDRIYTPRVWRCEECRAVLGFIFRDANRIKRLWVLRVQIKELDLVEIVDQKRLFESAESVQHARTWRVRAMDGGEVGCDACGAIQEWRASEDAMLELLRKAGGQELVEQYAEKKRRSS